MVVVFFFKGIFLPGLLLVLAVALAFSAQFFLVVVFLALYRVRISPDWFFIWHSLSLRPYSTQLLVYNHSGFCSH